MRLSGIEHTSSARDCFVFKARENGPELAKYARQYHNLHFEVLATIMCPYLPKFPMKIREFNAQRYAQTKRALRVSPQASLAPVFMSFCNTSLITHAFQDNFAVSFNLQTLTSLRHDLMRPTFSRLRLCSIKIDKCSGVCARAVCSPACIFKINIKLVWLKYRSRISSPVGALSVDKPKIFDSPPYIPASIDRIEQKKKTKRNKKKKQRGKTCNRNQASYRLIQQ